MLVCMPVVKWLSLSLLTVRPVPRKASEIGSSREALLAGAGVTVIGQRRRPHQLEA